MTQEKKLLILKSPDHIRTSWCGSADRFEWIDFNGDGKADMSCHSNAGNTWVLVSDGMKVSPPNNVEGDLLRTSWCGSADRFEWIDFNGDGKADMSCHSNVGNTWVLVSDGVKVSPLNNDGSGLLRTGWCGATDSFEWIDFNGDGKADMSCHSNVGNTWVLVSYEQSAEAELEEKPVPSSGGRSLKYSVYFAKLGQRDRINVGKHPETGNSITDTALKKCQNIILGFTPISSDNIEDTINISQFGCTSKQQVSFKTIIGQGDTAISAIQIKGQEDYVVCVYNFDADSFEFNDLLAQDLIILTNDQYHDDEL